MIQIYVHICIKFFSNERQHKISCTILENRKHNEKEKKKILPNGIMTRKFQREDHRIKILVSESSPSDWNLPETYSRATHEGIKEGREEREKKRRRVRRACVREREREIEVVVRCTTLGEASGSPPRE